MLWYVVGAMEVFQEKIKNGIMKFTYLLLNFFTALIPFIFSFHPKINFYKKWRYFLPATIIVAIVFILWDSYFTSRGVWSFNSHYVTGITIANLPLEEILFFICIPFACVFTYYCLDKFYNLNWKTGTEKIFTIIFSAFLLLTGLLNTDRLYTSYTFISTAILCIILVFLIKVRWFGKAVTVYSILLIPFFVVNGLLTGTGLEEPVVVYNDSENLNMRILTVPVEDAFYGFELFLLNLFFLLKFNSKGSTV